MNQTAKLAAAQMAVSEQMEENYRRSLRYMELAAAQHADLICFPEGHLAAYVPQYPRTETREYAIPLDHPYIRGFCEKSRELHLISCISPNIREGGKVYPSAVLISEEGRILAVGRKNHITRFPNYYEQDYYTPGNGGFVTADTSLGRIGLILCYDRHYPESFRTLALRGADLILVPVANDRTERLEIFEWEMRIAAYANSVNVLMCNRVGAEGRMVFAGQTLLADARGNIAAQADDAEQLLTASLDLTRAKRIREEMQYLALRRPEVFDLR